MTLTRPCLCDRFVPGTAYIAGRDCPNCWMFAHRPVVRRAWGGDPVDCLPIAPSDSVRSSALHFLLRSAYQPHPGDPLTGVVIGSFRWPSLVELQLRLLRRVCGPVPVLVSSDDPDTADRLTEVCAAHPDVALEVSPERIGHTGGDLSAFWRGLRWASARGLRVLAKLSQRFLVTRARWLQDGARELLASGLPLAARRCRGRESFPIRTEACLLDVAAWSRTEVQSRLLPRRYWGDRPGGLYAETVVHETLALLGGLYWPWSLLGEDRYAPDPGVVWHCSHAPEDYHRVAAELGVRLESGFHTSGWQAELATGGYSYG